jgi:DNA polymerase-3 subunit beta
MKFSLKKNELKSAVSWVSRTIQHNTSTPVLIGIKVVITNNSIAFSSYNYISSSEYIIPTKVTGETGELLFFGENASEIIKHFKGETIDIEKSGNKLNFTANESNYSLGIMAINEYPELPKLPKKIGSVSTSLLQKAVEQVGFAASKDETLPIITGIYLELEKNLLTFTATDKFRLSIKHIPFKSNNENLKFHALIKASNLSNIVKMFENTEKDNEDQEINIHFDPENSGIIGFSTLNKMITCALVDDDRYPEVKSVIPKNNENVVEFNIKEMLDAVKGLTLISNSSALEFNFNDIKSTITTVDSDESSGKETVNTKYKGQSLTIKFNPTYIKEVLQAIKTENASIKLNNNQTAIIVNEVDKGQVTKDFIHVLIPIV